MEEQDKTSNDDEQLEESNTENNDTSNEGESETGDEGEESDSVTLTKSELDERERAIRKEQDKRWKDRLKNAGKDEEDGDETKERTETKETTSDERYDRLELKTEGVTVKKEQDAVLEYARFKQIDVVEALNSPAMKAELKEMRAKSATPPSSNRTGAGRQDDVAYWAQQLEKNGKSAPTAELRAKVRAHLAGK